MLTPFHTEETSRGRDAQAVHHPSHLNPAHSDAPHDSVHLSTHDASPHPSHKNGTEAYILSVAISLETATATATDLTFSPRAALVEEDSATAANREVARPPTFKWEPTMKAFPTFSPPEVAPEVSLAPVGSSREVEVVPET